MSKPGSLINIAFDTGVITERERIIKLLEDKNKCPEYGACDDQKCWTVYAVIDLIKGENQWEND